METKMCYQSINDYLIEEEVIFSKEVPLNLKNYTWADKMLEESKISRAINVGTNPNRPYDELVEIKAALFEIRIANYLSKISKDIEYEYSAGVNNSTIDFKVGTNPKWLIELTSLRESKAVKENTLHNSESFIYASITKNDRNSAELRDIIKTQMAICAKTCSENFGSIKFPKPSVGSFHMIIVDTRTMNGGVNDDKDYELICFGNEYFKGKEALKYHRYWLNSNGEQSPILGLFSENYPDQRNQYVRERIHAIGFINEREYGNNYIFENIKIYYNPILKCEKFDKK